MKGFKSLRTILLSCCVAIATLCGALLFAPALDAATANAEGTIANTVYQTDGASVRVFEKQYVDGTSVLKETSRQGIRFHVEMGAGYAYGGKEILNTAETYERGSYKITEGFKTYTLVLPTRLLSGDLTVDTDKVMKIETTEYWFSDDDQNWESVAYIYNVPEKWYTDNFSFRGIICTVAEDGTETVVVESDVAERNLTWVAKQAYNDTIDENTNYWGTAEKDETAAPLIKKFVPTYNITYKVNGVETTEEVLWGDAPQNVPTEGVKGAWYDTNNNEEVDVSTEMSWTANRTLVLETTSSEEFVLTGVATQTNFEVTTDNITTTYNGFKVFATLHREAFAPKTQMDAKAVNIEHKRGDVVLEGDNAVTIQGVWTMEEQNSLGETQMLLFFAFDTSKLESGDQVIIKGDSVFYANNVMYKLTEDYTIDYTGNYGMYLGDLYNSDVKGITNCAEDNTGNQGKPNEFTIRVEFYEDVMINGEFTFEFGPDSDTTTYKYPVYLKSGETIIPVSGGRYYWNEGNNKILELIGTGDYVNKVFGTKNGDELIGAPGTIIKQNGGYYIFKDKMYSYFLTNGNVDAYGYALGDWVVGDEIEQYETSEFATQGTVTETTDYGTLADEIRITTENHWFGQAKVSMLTTEKMLDSAPYAIYCTSADGTVTEIEKVRYHGQSNGNGGYYQILGLCGEGKFTVGDVVTIAAGTRFWLGTEYYTVTEEITYYYTGSFWAQNYDASTMGELSSASFGDRAHNQGDGELRMYFTAPLAGYTEENNGAFDDLQIGTGSITLNGTPFTYVRYQRWDAGSTWLAFGGTGMSGKVALGDKVVIEAGTTIWSASNVAYKFTETVEWIYAGPNSANTSVTWSRVLGGVTVDATTENASVSGVGTFAVGNTYTLTVAPADGYLISEVIVNNVSLPLSDSNTYTFTVAQSNVITVNTVVGHKVIFSVPTGASVDSGAITNGTIKVVASGGSLTFTVAATEGYKLTGVTGATNMGDGTYTVSNVTADTTVTIAVEKLYKVTYSGGNTMATVEGLGTVADGFSTWVENGTTLTFTVAAASDYTLLTVENSTKNEDGTYTATVNGADLNVAAVVLKNDAFVDITDALNLENRNSWASDSDDVITFGALLGSAYFKSFTPEGVNATCWYQGNTTVIDQNNGVDILKFIYINGECARDLLIANQTAQKTTTDTGSWLSNPAAWPIAIETNGDVWIRLSKSKFTDTFTFTIKPGFRILDAEGNLTAVTRNIDFNYSNGNITKVAEEPEMSDTFVDITDRLQIENRTSWGAHDGEVYVGLLDTGITNTVTNEDGTTSTNNYFNTSVNGAWYVGNNDIITANGSVDIMEYIYVNGQSARALITANASGDRQGNSCDCWLSNAAAYPVYVESTNGSGLMMRFATAVFGTEFTITIKAGFRITNSEGNLVVVTQDITFAYNNDGTITKTIANA